jgi:hypothetical protein
MVKILNRKIRINLFVKLKIDALIIIAIKNKLIAITSIIVYWSKIENNFSMQF